VRERERERNRGRERDRERDRKREREREGERKRERESLETGLLYAVDAKADSVTIYHPGPQSSTQGLQNQSLSAGSDSLATSSNHAEAFAVTFAVAFRARPRAALVRRRPRSRWWNTCSMPCLSSSAAGRGRGGAAAEEEPKRSL